VATRKGVKMTEQYSLFDLPGNEKYKPKESREWDWKLSDLDKVQKNGLKVFSCFACGGGSTMGYKLAGCDVVGCCEIDPKMNEVYVKNHNPKYNYLMDIREFNKLDNLPEELYNLDILDGSPPCTTFSTAGNREEGWGKKKKFREGQAEQTLDDLSFVFIETVAKLRPKVVIMENVEGLIKGGAWAYVQKIYAQFKTIGYSVKHWLLKGEDMGVPQTRHRVFFIAARNDIGFNPCDLDMTFNYKAITYGEIKKGVGRSATPECQKLLEAAQPQDKDLSDIKERLGQKPGRFNEMLAWKDRTLSTITAKCSVYDAPELSFISNDTIIRASTFPSDYDFINTSYSNIGYICGMSVPPLMIKRIVGRLIESGIFKY
jgi:DNA (cytosine-5)-methyltransferase 1